MMGYQFNRQKPLDKYIVDFYCKPLHLVIEIDGKYHEQEEQVVQMKCAKKYWKTWGSIFFVSRKWTFA